MQQDDAGIREGVAPAGGPDAGLGVGHHARAVAVHVAGGMLAGLVGLCVCALLVVGAASMLGREGAQRHALHGTAPGASR